MHAHHCGQSEYLIKIIQSHHVYVSLVDHTEPITNAMTVDLTCDPVALPMEYRWVDVAAEEDILGTAATYRAVTALYVAAVPEMSSN